MPRHERELSVIPWEIGRFWVVSETKPGERWLVELDDPEWKCGHCDCPDFRVRIEAPVVRGDRPDHYHCKHIQAACEYLNNRLPDTPEPATVTATRCPESQIPASSQPPSVASAKASRKASVPSRG